MIQPYSGQEFARRKALLNVELAFNKTRSSDSAGLEASEDFRVRLRCTSFKPVILFAASATSSSSGGSKARYMNKSNEIQQEFVELCSRVRVLESPTSQISGSRVGYVAVG
jgi:hypothetical protein